MKILAICGSPRRGNTEAMLKRILDGSKEAGAEVELVLLKDKNIKHCDGCMACEATGTCHVDDDMPGILRKVLYADALALGTPNYFNNVSGLMKDFIDRINPYWESEKIKGKKAAIVCVGSEEEGSLGHCRDALIEFAEICKMRVVGTILAQAKTPGEAAQNEKIMQECFELGRKISAER